MLERPRCSFESLESAHGAAGNRVVGDLYDPAQSWRRVAAKRTTYPSGLWQRRFFRTSIISTASNLFTWRKPSCRRDRLPSCGCQKTPESLSHHATPSSVLDPDCDAPPQPGAPSWTAATTDESGVTQCATAGAKSKDFSQCKFNLFYFKSAELFIIENLVNSKDIMKNAHLVCGDFSTTRKHLLESQQDWA